MMKKRHWDNSEPVLIDEKFLKEAVLEQVPKYLDESSDKRKGIHFSEVLELCLDFRNIPRIDGLWEFTSLTKLDLNSNFIGKIEGLDHMVNLTWLGLSFNSIEKIEHLESLQKLKVLDLTNNRISVIENLDTLENLSSLYIGNNCLEQLDNVLYLRKFKNLLSINISGNPFPKDDDYKLFIAAYFPKLMYLDGRFLNNKIKNEASIEYHCVLEKTKHKELQKQQDDEAAQSQEAEVKLHTEAFVEFLNGSYLFESMVKDDPEAEILQSVPGVAPLLQTFKHQMVELCTQLFELGLSEHKQRETEVNSFVSAQTKAVKDCQQKGLQILAEFEQQHKERRVELQQLSNKDLLKVKIDSCNAKIEQLCDSLITLKLLLVSQLENIIKKLDTNISDMVESFCETVQGIFAQCRELENNYNEKVREIVLAILKDMANDEPEVDMPDDVKTLFTDRDAVMDALATGHDNHQLRISDRETQLVTRVNAWKLALIKGIQDKVLKQNRTGISDILRYRDYLREQLEDLEQHLQQNIYSEILFTT